LSETKRLDQLRAQIARAERIHKRTGDGSVVTELRRDYAAAKVIEFVKKTVDGAPPMTDEQRDMITALLRPSGGDLAAEK
jgi:hypothetical protein